MVFQRFFMRFFYGFQLLRLDSCLVFMSFQELREDVARIFEARGFGRAVRAREELHSSRSTSPAWPQRGAGNLEVKALEKGSALGMAFCRAKP